MWINDFVSTVCLFMCWLTPTGGVTNQMTHITFYYAEQRTTLAHASALCEYNTVGYLPCIDTKPKLKLYSSAHTFQNDYYYYAGTGSATSPDFWTNATRDPTTGNWSLDVPGQCESSSFLNDNIWIENTTATDVYCAAFGSITNPYYATDVAYIDQTRGLFAEHCSSGHMAVCEIQSSTPCMYVTDGDGWCPDPYVEPGDSYEHPISGIKSLNECMAECSNFISGDAECWALTYNKDAHNCTLFYFVNPLFLLYEDTAVKTCPGSTFLLRKCYNLTYVNATFDQTRICPSPSGCTTKRSCTFPTTSTITTTTPTTTKTSTKTTTDRLPTFYTVSTSSDTRSTASDVLSNNSFPTDSSTSTTNSNTRTLSDYKTAFTTSSTTHTNSTATTGSKTEDTTPVSTAEVKTILSTTTNSTASFSALGITTLSPTNRTPTSYGKKNPTGSETDVLILSRPEFSLTLYTTKNTSTTLTTEGTSTNSTTDGTSTSSTTEGKITTTIKGTLTTSTTDDTSTTLTSDGTSTTFTTDGTSTTLTTEGTSTTSTTDGQSKTSTTEGPAASSKTEGNITTLQIKGTSTASIYEGISTTLTTDGTSTTTANASTFTSSTTEGTLTTFKTNGTSTILRTKGTLTTSTSKGISFTSTTDSTSTSSAADGTATSTTTEDIFTASTTASTSISLATEGTSTNPTSPSTTRTLTTIYNCFCPCVRLNISNETYSTKFDEVISKLQLNSSQTSSYRRSKTSAEDHRIEAKAIGWIGLVVLVCSLASIVLSDIIRFFTGHPIKRGKQKKQSSQC